MQINKEMKTEEIGTAVKRMFDEGLSPDSLDGNILGRVDCSFKTDGKFASYWEGTDTYKLEHIKCETKEEWFSHLREYCL